MPGPARNARTPPPLPQVAICVATCRRPLLLRATLTSLAAQALAPEQASRIKVLVADNDAGLAGAAVVEAMRDGFPYPLQALSELTRGISFVRNRLVAAAGECDYIAFIDDDETAAPSWLSELLDTALSTDADAVLGPVETRYEAPPPAWLPPLLADPILPNRCSLPEDMFRTSSILLRADTLARIPGPFDPAFALTGGSDYMLGQALAALGARAVWAAHALVYEAFPPSRANLRWYLQRRFRTGLTYVKAQRARRGRLRGSAKGLYRAAGSLTLGGRDLARALTGPRTELVKAAGLIVYGLGNAAGAAGGRYEEYRTIHGR